MRRHFILVCYPPYHFIKQWIVLSKHLKFQCAIEWFLREYILGSISFLSFHHLSLKAIKLGSNFAIRWKNACGIPVSISIFVRLRWVRGHSSVSKSGLQQCQYLHLIVIFVVFCHLVLFLCLLYHQSYSINFLNQFHSNFSLRILLVTPFFHTFFKACHASSKSCVPW